MRLRDALDDYKRASGEETLFPGERRTLSGRFSGGDGRLVHVEEGVLRDFGYPLSGLTGMVRSRFGVTVDGIKHWFDDEASTQTYHDGTGLVVTTHDTPIGEVTQLDLTLGDAHLTGFETEIEHAEIIAYVSLAPDGRHSRVGQLHHEDVIEVYHETEHDFLGSSTGFSGFRGQIPATFDDLISDEPTEYPRPPHDGRYAEDRLSGDLVCWLPLHDGSTTLITLLTDWEETERSDALDRMETLSSEFTDREAFTAAADERAPVDPDADIPLHESVAADVRVLSLLTGDTGLRMAGPDFDPYYRHSGGYGYTWFRDDAEIALFVLESDQHLDLDLADWHARSARAYCETQRADGSWPHRVWPHNGALAPGWANARLEAGDGVDYQADQTGSVIAFLASYYAAGIDDRKLEKRVIDTLEDAVDSLDETLLDDGRPMVCQNAWEDSIGRFTHTTATFLEAYSALAATDLPIADHARHQATRVYDAVDHLWLSDRGIYALREHGEGGLDRRADSSTLGLIGAHLAYDKIGTVDDDRLDRLDSHVHTMIKALWQDPDDSDIAGLFRYEGDGWRQGEQGHEKIWTVSTGWGANAAAQLAALMADNDDDRAVEAASRARELLELVLPGGVLCEDTSYLPEQYFDTGEPDSATPLGWPHALRLATVSLMDERGMLYAAHKVVADD
ncbi:glucan 1,4-alpha-glucosidase [Halonotius terrestris]|uniref:Glucan 1,4-alpha-glucosidase n=1 Tax=Halonotius terrestris TaxID=2487750 RepID=A0A8J8PBU1_9EURY|nr:glycoside hydrolase family 15 protein [Halonotius terrestris]TQQ83684.1 glucan 1,4-alpha-glucosidase [Halonotius terrestris]